MFSWFRKKPSPDVEFATEPTRQRRHHVRLLVPADFCLTRAEQKSLRRFGLGVRQWWLSHHRFGFARVDLGRGDRPIDRHLNLPAGHYTLGVGRGNARRRYLFSVTSDGSLAATLLPRTEAHAECLT